jgi:hypothetical protein
LIVVLVSRVVADFGDSVVNVVRTAAATAVMPIFWVYVVLLFRSLKQLKGQAA